MSRSLVTLFFALALAVGCQSMPAGPQAAFGRVHLVARTGDAWQGVADLDWEGTAAGTDCASDGAISGDSVR